MLTERYISIDIETLGLEPECCDIIEFGAVIDDGETPIDKLPTFHRYILPPKRVINGVDRFFYQGDPFAMAMHSTILKRISKKEEPHRYCIPKHLGIDFWSWLCNNGYEGFSNTKSHEVLMGYIQPEQCAVKINVGGKNFQGFDLRFLRRLPDFEKYIKFNHRVHDPAALYFNPKTDKAPPSLEDCLHRAGIQKSVEHTAIADAQDVIKVLRHKWEKMS